MPRYHITGERNEHLSFNTVFDNDPDAKPKMTEFICEACPLGALSGEAACVQDDVDFDLVCKLRAHCNTYIRNEHVCMNGIDM